MEEIHLFIIWSKAGFKKSEILQDISKNFEIVDIYNITWSNHKFSENLTRFYGENLPKNSHKEKHCGKGAFACIIVKDNCPVYEQRLTSKGKKFVNKNIFDSKQLYREWTGGGHKVHATDNIEESKTQLLLLLNLQYDKLIKKTNKHKIREQYISRDLIGSDGWDSFKDVFKILNLLTRYVILRNFENLESELTALHPDVDLLVENKKYVIDLLNAKPTSKKKYRVQYNVIINDKKINFDLRYIGDDYYCQKWEGEILKYRVKESYFYRPDDINYFYSLLYHALLHKHFLTEDYIEKLINLSKSNIFEPNFKEDNSLCCLNQFIHDNNYNYSEPEDLSVFWNSLLLSKEVKNKCSDRRRRHQIYIDIRQKFTTLVKRIIK